MLKRINKKNYEIYYLTFKNVHFKYYYLKIILFYISKSKIPYYYSILFPGYLKMLN